DFDRDSRTLDKGEWLRFNIKSGELRALSLVQEQDPQYKALNYDAIHFEFTGVVDQISTGKHDRQRNLMPTRLEYIQAHHGVQSLWAGILYMLGVILAVFRFLSKP
ncbi:hypothetical protein, partial [Candidatus Venteria ishoeyi]